MRATVCVPLRVRLGSQYAWQSSLGPVSRSGPRADNWEQKQYLGPVPTIVLNGESRPIQPGQTVAALIAELGLDRRQVAVERNREVVPRAEHEQTALADGDKLEVVTFVGGG